MTNDFETVKAGLWLIVGPEPYLAALGRIGAEVERLRAALGRIADPEEFDANWRAMRRVAARALAGTPELRDMTVPDLISHHEEHHDEAFGLKAEVERLRAEVEGMDQAALERVQQVSRERDARLEFCPRCNLRLRPARAALAEEKE